MEEGKKREQIELFTDGYLAVLDIYEQYAKSVGLSFTSYSILEAIYYTPENCTQTLIAQKTYTPKQSVNSVITDFWKKGYIELNESPTDRRNKTIKMTDAGMDYAKVIISKLSEAELAAIEKIPLSQIKLFKEVTKKFVDSVSSDLNLV